MLGFIVAHSKLWGGHFFGANQSATMHELIVHNYGHAIFCCCFNEAPPIIFFRNTTRACNIRTSSAPALLTEDHIILFALELEGLKAM